jgi:hypothetical protein
MKYSAYFLLQKSYKLINSPDTLIFIFKNLHSNKSFSKNLNVTLQLKLSKIITLFL